MEKPKDRDTGRKERKSEEKTKEREMEIRVEIKTEREEEKEKVENITWERERNLARDTDKCREPKKRRDIPITRMSDRQIGFILFYEC